MTAKIINHEDIEFIQNTVEPAKAASHVLKQISASLQGGTDAKFDQFLSILENKGDLFFAALAKEMKKDLSENTTGMT